MSKAFITSFHNYSEGLNTEYYKIFYDYFVNQFPLWGDLVDAVYIIDTNWNFTQEDKERLHKLHKNVTFYKAPEPGHHNKQYQDFLPQIKEDEMLFMDNDVLIFSRQGISDWFEHIRALSYAYLLLSYKKLGMRQYEECLKNRKDFIDRMNWFGAIDTKGKYTNETLEILKELHE